MTDRQYCPDCGRYVGGGVGHTCERTDPQAVVAALNDCEGVHAEAVDGPDGARYRVHVDLHPDVASLAVIADVLETFDLRVWSVRFTDSPTVTLDPADTFAWDYGEGGQS